MKKIFNKLFKKRKKGFTLIEILVVIIILGVLAGIAVPTYNRLIQRSRVSDGLHGLDTLAGAQEKYFVAHGFYAQDLKRLNAPFKEYRIGEHNDIFTTNFTYTKSSNRSCIEAQSNRDDYKLVKNYITKEKIFCVGEFCENISDYVSEISEGAYSLLCPFDNSNVNNCNLTEADCGEDEYLDPVSCQCLQLGNGGDNCTPCDSGTFSVVSWFGGPCRQIGSSTNSKTSSTPQQDDLDVQSDICGNFKYTKTCEPNSQGQYCVTTKRTCEPKDCELLHGEGWHLAGLNFPGHDRCDCIKECTGPQPSISEVCPQIPNCNKQICDPCTSSVSAYIHNNEKSGDSILEDSCCGVQNTLHNRVECDYSTGQWACVNDEDPCERIEVTGAGEDCDGTDQYPEATEGNTCGVKKFDHCSLDQTCDIIPSFSCVLKSENQCFDGQTRTCTLEDGTQGVEHCVECKWDNNCVNPCDLPDACTPGDTQECPDNPELTQTCNENCQWVGCEECNGIPMLQDLFVPNTASCLKYNQECIKNEETNAWEWQYTTETWVNDYGEDNNCITGMVASCNNFNATSNGGGKGMVNPCCDLACQNSCRLSCTTNGQIHNESTYQQCVNRCIEDNGGRCSGGGTGDGGIGGNCPAQYCPSDYYWNYNYCTCLPISSGGGGEDSTLYKYCIDCHWSDCGYCDPSDPQANGYTTQCANYKSYCWYDIEDGIEPSWVSGQTYYESLLAGHIGNNDPVIEWYGDNNCENGQWKYCNDKQGKQHCNDCHWSECVLAPYHIETVTGLVDKNGNASSCNGTINITYINSPSNWCENHPTDTYTTCDLTDEAECIGSTASLQSCGNITNYHNYCNLRGSGTACVISGNTPCPSANCVERWCDGSNPDMPQTVTRNCSRTLQILRCD